MELSENNVGHLKVIKEKNIYYPKNKSFILIKSIKFFIKNFIKKYRKRQLNSPVRLSPPSQNFEKYQLYFYSKSPNLPYFCVRLNPSLQQFKKKVLTGEVRVMFTMLDCLKFFIGDKLI